MNSTFLIRANGWRYPLVGGTRQRHFGGTSFKPHKLPENAQTPTRRVHAVLAHDRLRRLFSLNYSVPDLAQHHNYCSYFC